MFSDVLSPAAHATASPAGAPACIAQARLPRWLLPQDWPCTNGELALARIALANGRIGSVAPEAGGIDRPPNTWDLAGGLLLPGLIDAHLHLDKAYTLPRARPARPGLLAAIDAVIADRAHWSDADIRARVLRGLAAAHAAGVTRVRTHVDWWDAAPPPAWDVIAGLAPVHAGVAVEQVALVKLGLFAQAADAAAIAARVRATGPHAVLGGFVHSSNWDAQALAALLGAAADRDLDVDLHCDEELNPDALGLEHVARRAREMRFEGRIVCGHVCALAAMPEARALAILDEVARAPITLVSLPVTNLLLQDAVTGRTPRQRGITLVKEARARGIPLLFASDNVQDPFCPVGSFDPVESFMAAALAAQLDAPFDRWSDTLCRADFLARGTPAAPSLVGRPADFVAFPQADATSFPSRAGVRTVMRAGRLPH